MVLLFTVVACWCCFTCVKRVTVLHATFGNECLLKFVVLCFYQKPQREKWPRKVRQTKNTAHGLSRCRNILSLDFCLVLVLVFWFSVNAALHPRVPRAKTDVLFSGCTVQQNSFKSCWRPFGGGRCFFHIGKARIFWSRAEPCV